MARPRAELKIPADKLPPGEWFTVPQVAELTGVCTLTIQNRLKSGELEGKKLGGVWRIYREAIEGK